MSRAIVSAHYTILVRKQTALLTNDRTEVVVTNENTLQKDKEEPQLEKASEDPVSPRLFS